MKRIENRIVLRASDLTDPLACSRLTALEPAGCETGPDQPRTPLTPSSAGGGRSTRPLYIVQLAADAPTANRTAPWTSTQLAPSK